MLRLSVPFIIFCLFFTKALAVDVLVTTKAINFNEIIDISSLKKTSVDSVKRHCTPVSLKNFKNKQIQATHYMRKGYVLCENDIKEYKKESVIFDFGAIQIEKEGEVIFENDEYLRIKRTDGKIEKIYKDGLLR